MPFDSNGNFSLVPGTIVSDGMTIQPSQHNPPFQDVANGLSQVALRDGRAPMTGPLNMNNHKITGIADGTADTDAATVGQSALRIGDFKDTVRPLDSTWLKRDGSIYANASYPVLSSFFPPLPDGLLWEPLPPVSGLAGPVRVASGVGSAVAIVTSSTVLFSTSDGITWVPTALTFSPTSVAWGGGRYVVLGDNSKSAISIDGGVSWNTSDNTLDPHISGQVKYSGGLFAVANIDVTAPNPRSKISTSIDGIVWTVRRTSPDLRTYRVLIGDSSGFVARDANSFYVSTDGLTWPETPSNIPLSSVETGARTPSGRSVFVGGSGSIITTDDFSTATNVTSGTTLGLNDVFSFGPYMVIVGQDGVSRVSSDNATNFTASFTNTTRDLYSIAQHPVDSDKILVSGDREMLTAVQTLSSQFRVPNDNPTYGWIKAL